MLSGFPKAINISQNLEETSRHLSVSSTPAIASTGGSGSLSGTVHLGGGDADLEKYVIS